MIYTYIRERMIKYDLFIYRSFYACRTKNALKTSKLTNTND